MSTWDKSERPTKLLIANRGEIAIRIIRSARILGLSTVAIYAEDDGDCLHCRQADEAVALVGSGVSAYLDHEQIIARACQVGARLIHPGYGFLSESSQFAAACYGAGLIFVGPDADTLTQLGDKTNARALAQSLDIPTVPGSSGAADLAVARQLLEEHGAIMLKAIAGGGGRGMASVRSSSELASAWQRCTSEAKAAFGDGALLVEALVEQARHIEIQIVGDGAVAMHLGERECSLQRRHQKLMEFAPSPNLSEPLREALYTAAVSLAEACRYHGLGTFEFLVSGDAFYFIEVNPRIQVEHTVTEAVTGNDLVATQLLLSQGRKLDDLNLNPHVQGYAVQLRVNMETLNPDGSVLPSSGMLRVFDIPSGPNIRVDTFGYTGYTTNPRYDSLLAKVIVNARDYPTLLHSAYHALSDFHIAGVDTNIAFLQGLLRRDEVVRRQMHVQLIDQLVPLLSSDAHPRHYFSNVPGSEVIDNGDTAASAVRLSAPQNVAIPADYQLITAPMSGTVIRVAVTAGQKVSAGQEVLVLDAMKMEHVINASDSGIVHQVLVVEGDGVIKDQVLLSVEPYAVDTAAPDNITEVNLDEIRADLREVIDRHALGLDAARPQAVARRRKSGQRTARENITQLVDDGSFKEYGALAIAAQRQRHPLDKLIADTPADGLIAGIASINGDLYTEGTQCAVLSYDYTVLAGTQGVQNHRKKDRLFEIAESQRLPLVFFTEGGGGRPGDTDGANVVGLDCQSFNFFGRLSGLVPLIGITSGRCFAGNAALLGCCDVIIATRGANIGMGGPAMIAGGGLGDYHPEDIGPLKVQIQNGVVDIAVTDEAEAITVAKRYLSYFQGVLATYDCGDQRALRWLIPENRLRSYDIRRVVETMADTGSVLELRRDFGVGMVTAFARIEGRPVGVIANNPAHLAGAIDSDAADKATRFMQLCDGFDIPLLFLCDTPGIMVGPEAEKTALVRHAARLFVTGSNLTVPFFTIVLRKCYGLGAQAMAGGSYKAPLFAVAWPTGEFGGMGVEGAIKLGYRKELDRIADPAERETLFKQMVDDLYARGKGVNVASAFEIDDVIDPAESRAWILSGLQSAPRMATRSGKKRPNIDTW